jgi:hypothetical protein
MFDRPEFRVRMYTQFSIINSYPIGSRGQIHSSLVRITTDFAKNNPSGWYD